MHTPRFRTRFALLVLASLLTSCTDIGGSLDPVLIQWCGSSLCDWRTDSGTIKSVGTWNKHDKAVSFEGTGTQISRLSENKPIKCMRINTILDAAPDAGLSLLIDFNDDGRVEYEHAIPAGNVRFGYFGFAPPVDYRSVRYIVKKQGEGRAVLVQLSVDESASEMYGNPCSSPPMLLDDGSACSVDESCWNGLCSNGFCSPCGQFGRTGDPGTAACGDGMGCHSNGQCASGVCAAGICQSCALDGSCPALSNCDRDDQCQSGACLPRLTPSTVTELTPCLSCTADAECGRGGTCTNGVCETCAIDPLPKQCAECTDGTQCASGICSFGICGSCTSDDQCPSGEKCRFVDLFDVGPRVCTSEVVTALVRGALCESNEECSDGLACGAAGAQPKRCGIACGSDPTVCGGAAVCTRASLSEKDGVVYFPQRIKPAFADVGARVATCYTLITEEEKETKPCTFHAECASEACCDGICGGEYMAGERLNDACYYKHNQF